MTYLKHLEKALILSQKETLFALDNSQKKFGKKPKNPTVFISQKKLFLQLAATWIPKNLAKSSDKNRSDHTTLPIIQIHPKLLTEKKKRLFTTRCFSYSLQEVLSHEFVHLVRHELFPEKEQLAFEEILAYQTSPSKLRRFLGPLFSKPQDVLWLAPLFLSPLWIAFWPDLLMVSWLGPALLLFRFCLRQWAFQKAKKKLASSGVKQPLHTLIQFTDREIWALAFKAQKYPQVN